MSGIRRHPLAKCKGLLDFHRKCAGFLAVAVRCGNIQTTASYKRALKDNARVLRAKLLFNTDGTRL